MRRRNHRVSVYFDEKERARFRELAKKSGLSHQAYIRHLISGVIPAEKPPTDYYVLLRELHATGNNLNQLAHHAHATGIVDATRYDRNVAKLDNAIQTITEAVTSPRKYQ